MCPKVLILEDDAVTAKAYEMLLKSCQCDVQIAPHIEPAMKLCRENWPNAIILDIQLPMEDVNGIGCWDGRDFLKWVRSMVKNPPPIFIVSSHAPGPLKDELLAEGATAYFQKPISRSDLAKAVYRAAGVNCPVCVFNEEPQVSQASSTDAPSRVSTSRFGGLFHAVARAFSRNGSS